MTVFFSITNRIMKTSQVIILLCLFAVCFVATGQTKRVRKRWNRCGSAMAGIEQNITALWQKVNTLSAPVHVHVHGVGTLNDDVTVTDKNSIRKERHHQEEEVSEKHKHRNYEEVMKEMGGHEEEDQGSSSSSEAAGDSAVNRGPSIHIHLNIPESKAVPREAREETLIRDIPRQHINLQHEMNNFAEHEFPDEYINARCDMRPNVEFPTNHEVQGSIYFRQKPSKDLEVNIDLYGFYVHPARDSETRHRHGFHVHTYGDISSGCNSFGGHFNPSGVTHGGLEDEHKYIGDWGNIESDYRGIAKQTMRIKHSSLYGPHSIAGRGIVVHAEGDDHGHGGSDASKSSGNAGARIACCIIGYSNEKVNENWQINKN